MRAAELSNADFYILIKVSTHLLLSFLAINQKIDHDVVWINSKVLPSVRGFGMLGLDVKRVGNGVIEMILLLGSSWNSTSGRGAPCVDILLNALRAAEMSNAGVAIDSVMCVEANYTGVAVIILSALTCYL
ncbi:Uncharacterized protein Fot_50017 [Forsythia ovata]|uniref:Uncharacterized protein n=1 Tax=Forsythia ovata TaxID=205694 RepID=A0ABD1PWX2_9LAMI